MTLSTNSQQSKLMKPKKAKTKKKISDFTTEEGRHVWGIDGGGMLIFRHDGTVRVLYRQEAVMAASHGSNRAASKIVSHGELTPEFQTADHFARLKRQGFDFPEDPDDPQVVKLLEIFRKDVWPMVLAMAEGESKPLKRLADAVDNSKMLAIQGALQTVNFDRVARAISHAAEKREGLPTIPHIVEAFGVVVPDFEEGKGNADTHVRKMLPKMGLGWLAGKVSA